MDETDPNPDQVKPPAMWWHVEALKPWDENPNEHPPAQVIRLRESIRTNGWGRTIVAHWPTCRIVAGHGARLAALELLKEDSDWQLADAPGPGMVPVRFREDPWEDLEPLAVADNEIAKGAKRNDATLAAILERMQKRRAQGLPVGETGLTEKEIARILRRTKVRQHLRNVPDPGARTPPAEPDSQVGQVYELGPHRLVCGDSTDPDVWGLLLGDEKIQALWTDPPYGVSYTGGTLADREGIKNDDLSEPDLYKFLHTVFSKVIEGCEKGAAIYVAGPNKGAPGAIFVSVLHSLAIYRHLLIWLKDRFILGRSDYHYRHEPIYYGWVPGGPHNWFGDRKQDTVFEIPRPKVSKEHPTMKPVELVEAHLENSAASEWLIGDPFGGSGTTLIAAARLSMRARLIEIDPKYSDVIRDRWTRFAEAAGLDPGPGALKIEQE